MILFVFIASLPVALNSSLPVPLGMLGSFENSYRGQLSCHLRLCGGWPVPFPGRLVL